MTFGRTRPTVASLAYTGIEAADPAKWATFAKEILGAQAAPGETADTQYVRFDDRAQRLTVSKGSDGRTSYIGWDVSDGGTLAAFAELLKQRGVQYERGTREECRHRRVRDLIWFLDPAGNRTELCYGAEVSATPFRPARPELSGFVALGHVVVGVSDLAAAERFYVDVLGFKVTDYIDFKAQSRPEPLAIVFLRCDDGRNHSIALMKGNGLDHLMVEVKDIDDVGRTLGLCRQRNVPMRGNLGRHSNDLMISFYLTSPSGLRIEYGCGGSYVDDATWQVRYMTTASLWGHSSDMAPSS
jgi:3,4-dihydroxy-9,10-secoandrosta-1,3,5(10)-triene-9,17-dione 4,5-dioxygenase